MEEHKKIGVPNTGLIILWPFLTAYFERAGYMLQGTFVSAAL
jgi:hypothetical protein